MHIEVSLYHAWFVLVFLVKKKKVAMLRAGTKHDRSYCNSVWSWGFEFSEITLLNHLK